MQYQFRNTDLLTVMHFNYLFLFFFLEYYIYWCCLTQSHPGRETFIIFN